MKFIELMRIAFLEERSQKKHSRMMFLFMLIAMVWFVGIHSLTGSIQQSMESLLEKPMGRVVSALGENEEMDVLYEQLTANAEAYPMVQEVFYNTNPLYATWEDSAKLVKKDSVEIRLEAYFSGIDDFWINEKTGNIEENEIVVPKYLYNIGIFNEYQYADGEALLGKEITLRFEDKQQGGFVSKNFHVVGVYDNVQSQCQTQFFISDRQMVELYQLQMEISEKDIADMKEVMKAEGIDEQAICAEIVENYDGDEQAFWESYFGTNQKYVSIYLADGYEREKSKQFLQQKTGYLLMDVISLDQSLMTYFDFILYMGNLTSFLFLLAAVLNIFLTVAAEVRRRKAEFALKQAMGYRQETIFWTFAIGKFWCLFQAVIWAVLVTGIISLAGNYVIENIFPFYLRYIVLFYDGKAVLAGILAVILATALGMGVAIPMMKRICVAEVLKKEG